MIKEKQGQRQQFGSEKRIELLYIRTQGLQKELEKICSFSTMKPEKVVARLGKNTIHILSTIDSSDYRILFGVATDPETSHLLICLAHLQSESHKILYIDFSKIEWITEEGHEGESVTLNATCAHNGHRD